MRSVSHALGVVALGVLAVPSVHAQGVVTRDVDYVPDAVYEDGRDLLDVYRPEDASGAPVVLFFHGGALMGGSKDMGQIMAERLVPEGVVVVSANYRLSPTVQHPGHVQDAARAAAWVIESIQEYGGDPGRVVVSGHSAGAYLAALLLLDPTYLGAHDLEPSALLGSVPISPFLYVEETAPSRPKIVWGEDPDDWLAASVTPHITAGKGRMLLIYADGDDDWRREQNDRFAAEMRRAGNGQVRAIEVPDRNHGSIRSGMTQPDDRVGALILDFLEGTG